MVIPELNTFSVVSVDFGEEIDDFTADIYMDIGEAHSEGGETFHLEVTSPKRLERILKEHPDEVEIGRGLFIAVDYNIHVIERQVERLIKACKRSTWTEVSQALSCYFYDEKAI
ncbi:immunity 8 family protein [Halobacillus yeomjeoni]|uniref:Imm8 family immunity protein n=1 Tax=Halobacillus yeomjeoni TaxID=311194 RepID=UPI001CD4FFD9|nr:Imm8 family immunity protein [Halobacillus yeomjeoni]MCA0983384.1 immunity 8 family protein [Halobacillus yeomjeoni]